MKGKNILHYTETGHQSSTLCVGGITYMRAIIWSSHLTLVLFIEHDQQLGVFHCPGPHLFRKNLLNQTRDRYFIAISLNKQSLTIVNFSHFHVSETEKKQQRLRDRDKESQISFKSLTLSALGGVGPSIIWGGGQFDPHFLTAPRGLIGP